MDNNFINDNTSIPLISRRDLVIIIIAGSVSVFSGLLLTNPVDPSFELAHLLNSVNTVGMIFASGLFSFLTAGLLFSSRASRFYLQRRIDEVGVTEEDGISDEEFAKIYEALYEETIKLRRDLSDET